VLNRCTAVEQDVTVISADDGGVDVACGIGRDRYDCVVNTIDLKAFNDLRRVVSQMTSRTVFLHVSKSPPRVFTRVPVDMGTILLNSMVYFGDEGVPFHRVSCPHGKEWVAEAMFEVAGPAWDRIVPWQGKVAVDDLVETDPRVVHVGRWAELDPEMMVSDVIGNLSAYRKKIVDACG
jgi:hypothetical protein